MTEYIEKEKAIKDANTVKVPGLPQWKSAVGYTIEKLKSIPAADVKPVTHGKWIFEEYELASWCTKAICSSCKKTVANNSDLAHDWGQKLFLHDYQFCPKCGADMREEKQ